jgi:hypothetical protein
MTLAQSTVDCSTVVEDRARLKCYDEQAARQKKAAAAASPAPAAASKPARATSPSSDFGLNEEALRKRQAASNPDTPKDPEQLVARVAAVAKKPRGEFRITLDDGQVWEETQHSSSSIPPGVGDTVTIKRGLLGSYFLERGAGLALRVKRTD